MILGYITNRDIIWYLGLQEARAVVTFTDEEFNAYLEQIGGLNRHRRIERILSDDSNVRIRNRRDNLVREKSLRIFLEKVGSVISMGDISSKLKEE